MASACSTIGVLLIVAAHILEIWAQDEIQLSANQTLQGDICPSGIEFTCTSQKVDVMEWYLGDVILASYYPDSKGTHSENLCDSASNNKILNDFCESGGSLSIQSVRITKGIYNISSSLVTTGTYIYFNQYDYVDCGDNSNKVEVLTNYTMTCNPVTLDFTYNNTNVDGGTCDGVVEFICEGSDVNYFQWMYNDFALTENFTYSTYNDSFFTNESSLHGVSCSVTFADTDNCFADKFNFESVCIADLSYLKAMNVSSIGCSSNDGYNGTVITCTTPSTIVTETTEVTETSPTRNPTTTGPTNAPWYKYLSFLDFLPFCNVSESTTSRQNAECFGICSAMLLAICIILLILCCSVCCCLCYLCKRRRPLYEHVNSEDPKEFGSSGKATLMTCCYLCKRRRPLYEHVNSEDPKEFGSSGKATPMTCFTSGSKEEDIDEGLFSKCCSFLPRKRCCIQKRYSSLTVNEVRTFQGEEEEEAAYYFSKQLFSEYGFEMLEDLGSRLQKFWYLRMKKNKKNKQKKTMLQITVKKSTMSPVRLGKEEVVVLKGLMDCLKHPWLLTIHDLACNDDYVSFLIDYVEDGSLRDKLYAAIPHEDWSDKYSTGVIREVFTTQEIAVCGRHILEAVLLLYKQGFPAIGQIHCGNVFHKNGRYILGGYENCLLGYRTGVYGAISSEGLLKSIDVLMIGQMIYQMATGLPLGNVFPKDSELQKLDDIKVKEVLQYIFNEELRNMDDRKKVIRKILKHRFFDSDERISETATLELTTEGQQLISVVAAAQSGTSDEIYKVANLDMAAVLDQLKDTYTTISLCERIGWRNGRAWAKVKSEKFGSGLLSAVEVPDTCPVFVEPTLDSIKALLKLESNHLLTIHDLHYLKVGQAHVVVLFQQFCDSGSLKDRLHQTSPLRPWEDKYRTMGVKLTNDEIAKIGYQILKIASSLCFIDGSSCPLKLRFLHTGNIFIDGDHCLLGGIENMLLGCRPRDYVKFRDYLHCIDTVMFGHMIFELASGLELSTALPLESDYDSISSPVKEVLKTIFAKPTMDLKEISSLGFFMSHQIEAFIEPKVKEVDIKTLLEKVRKDKPRNQDNIVGKMKYSTIQMPARRVRDKITKHGISATTDTTSTNN